MGRTSCREPQCLYKFALYLYPLLISYPEPNQVTHKILRNRKLFIRLKTLFGTFVTLYIILLFVYQNFKNANI